MHHIVTNLSLPNQIGIDITKFNFKQIRDYSIFKILVPDGLFSKLLCPNFWPADIIVHEYIKKKTPFQKTKFPDVDGQTL